MAVSAAGLKAEDYSITTFSGNANSAGNVDGAANVATFNNPYSVAIDSAKNLYVADTVNHTIRKITPGQVTSTLAGSPNSPGTADGTGSAARFSFPVGVAADSSGNVYVTDTNNFTIRKITSAGVVSTFAGTPFQVGSTDGTGSAARFFLPYGIAVDSSGNVYVAEGGNHLIRKITPGGVVSTLAGSALQAGFTDGTGGAARFNKPWGLTIDGSGNLYVADSGNNAIRKITSAGVVTTVAGSLTAGAQDGPGTVARFNQPRGVAVDSAGNLYVADHDNALLRQITPAGVVSTIAGAAGIVGSVDSVGAAARFYDLTGIVADGSTVYIADTSNNQIRRGMPASAAPLPVITVQPIDQVVSTGQAVSFRVVATGSGLNYQWLKNTVAIAGATSATYSIASAQASDIASYTVHISNSGGGIDSGPGTLSVEPLGSGPIIITARPISINVDTGQSASFSVTASGSGLTYQWLKNSTAIAGATSPTYTIASAQAGDVATYTVRLTSGTTTETASAKLLVGGAGAGISITSQPSSITVTSGQTASFSVTAFGSGLTYQWFKNGAAISGATTNTYVIAAVQASDAGTYTARVSGGGSSITSDAATLTVGASPPSGPTSRLSNLSILTSLGSASDTFTMGYVVGGAGTSGSKSILIRAAGPTLGAAPFNIQGVVADPKLETFAGSTKNGENDNWGGTAALKAAFTAVGAFPYVSDTSLDAAVLANISAGDNSVRVSGTGSGTVIAELYDSTPFANLTATSPRLVNVSVLKQIGSLLTVGFVIDGTSSKKVLIRAVGPTLSSAPFNVQGVVADPQMTLFSGQTPIGSNNDWGGTAELTAAFSQVGAFALPANSKDAAMLTSLQPGAYTVQVTGVGGTTGVAIVEVYEVQ